MLSIFKRNNIKILVDFAAVNETLYGVVATIIGLGCFSLSPTGFEPIILLGSGLFLLLIGGLLLYGIAKGHAKSVLVHLIISTPNLLATNIFYIYIGIVSYMSDRRYLPNLVFPLVCLVLIIMSSIFVWVTQFSIYLYYKELKSSGKNVFDYNLIEQNRTDRTVAE